MKIIIAGGRDYKPTPEDIDFLDTLKITEVVSGKARGADKFGEDYAGLRSIPVKPFKADWVEYGKAAGPIRNRQMAEYADAVVLFAGGRGTQSMRREAEKNGLIIYER